MLFDPVWLNGRPHFGDEIAYSTVLALCDDLNDKLQHRLGFAGRVRTFVLANLGRNVTLEGVAAHFDTPVRTLRRKLRDEETSFREILDDLRSEVATKYLRDTHMTIDDVSSALGFSETSNFRQAFRRWKQASPQQYRRQLQQADAMSTLA
jgi:AraC-like DNA-binding protein